MQIFISSVSQGLISYRNIVTEVVAAQAFIPVVEEHFPTPQKSIMREIQEKVFYSAGVIALVGPYYGTESPKIGSNNTPVSYSQYELLYALEYKKPCLVLFTGEHFIPDGGGEGNLPTEDSKMMLRQAEFAAKIRAMPELAWCLFNNAFDLALALAKHRWESWLDERRP